MDPQTFIFFGRSGSGKGTQARLLEKHLEETTPNDVVYIETGDKIRDFIEKDGYTPELTRDVLNSGGLLPEFIPIWLWTNDLVNEFTGEEHLILDGLSRRLEEASVLDSAIKFYKRKNPTIIYLNVSRERAFDMLKQRGRHDDTDEYINSRLDWFDEHVVPAIEYFKDKKYTFLDIDGNQPIADTNKEILTKAKLI